MALKFKTSHLIVFFAFGLTAAIYPQEPAVETGSVVFIHPDGSNAAMWAALRLLDVGPDGNINWDNMARMGLYRGHLTNSTNSTSHAGATVHAFGVKVPDDTYGIHPDRPFKSRSGKDLSIMMEAQKAGKSIALINSGHICEPGTGVFAANSARRAYTDTISQQIIYSGADVIFSGGERLLLPEGVMGRHGEAGRRKDGRNLINEAGNLGYTVIYTRDELLALPDDTEKVLGVFSANHTFNDRPEEALREANLPLYNEKAPTLPEMTEAALKILTRKGKDFLMVIEEEGTDNFANDNNARGTMEALRRADAAIGVVMSYIDRHPKTLLITAADSNAGGMVAVCVKNPDDFEKNLPPNLGNGAPLDGRDGTGTPPFITAPDQFGNQLRFGIAWSTDDDAAGGVIARTHGLNAGLLTNNVDNTDIYRIMYATLFGVLLP